MNPDLHSDAGVDQGLWHTDAYSLPRGGIEASGVEDHGPWVGRAELAREPRLV